jgi:hypothetical protein
MTANHLDVNLLLRRITDEQHGFLMEADLKTLAKADRLRQVLVRCGGCRFTCPAQDAEHLIEAVELAGDYVRDVSLPVSDPMYQPRFSTR